MMLAHKTRRTLYLAIAGVFIAGAVCAGFNLGMTGAVKKRVKEVDREVKKQVAQSQALKVTGSVVKGPVSGATVTFYELKADGTKGAMLGTTTTETDGTFALWLIPAPTTSPFLGEAAGGSYVDEVSGATVLLTSADAVSAVLPAGTTRATLTLLTHMAAARAREFGGCYWDAHGGGGEFGQYRGGAAV